MVAHQIFMTTIFFYLHLASYHTFLPYLLFFFFLAVYLLEISNLYINNSTYTTRQFFALDYYACKIRPFYVYIHVSVAYFVIFITYL